MDIKIVVLLSVLAQLTAAVLALRLIRVTGRQAAWLFISLALFGMAVRRIIPLYGLYAGRPPAFMDPAFEWVGLVVSLCMLAGIAWIGPVFETIRSHADDLRRSEENFRRIVGTAQEGILFTDDSANARYVNQRLADMVGWTAEEMQGRPINGIFAESSCAEVMQRLGSAGEEKVVHLDCRLRRKDGSTVWAIISANPVVGDAGKPIGALAMVTDISERKKLEREREVLIEELQAALANVKTLKGLLPICAWCNKVRDDHGDWHPMEVYIKIHSDASFSHGICPECRQKI